MSFLYPGFLFALSAISIPIVIHLFNFQRPKTILFTNVKYLREVKESTSNRLKLKHLLILLCRIAFIALLVLSFAQPFMAGKNAALMKDDPNVLVYLDNSFSMQNQGEEGTLMEEGVKAIEKLSHVYPHASEFALLTNDFEGRDQFFVNKEKMSERLTEINYSNISRSNLAIQKRILKTLNEGKKSHIFLISDFQKSTGGDLNSLKADTVNEYYILPLKARNKGNIYIDSVWLTHPLVRPHENNSMELKIANSGEKEINDLVVKLYIDDIQVSSANVTIGANASANASFNFNINSGGQKKCKIAFEDFPVTFDNTHYFVLNVAPKIKILHLFDGDKTFINKVYQNENIFDIQSSNIGNTNYSSIASSNLIVLENVGEIPSAMVTSLKEFIKKGGSLFIAPPRNLDLESYNTLFKGIYVPEIQKQKADTLESKLNVTLTPPDLNNPFFSNIFEKMDRNINMPYGFPVIKWGNKGEKLLKVKSNDPFLSLFNWNSGKIYLINTYLSSNYTNFHRHAVFVPVMYKIAFRSQGESERMAYFLQDQTMNLKVESVKENAIYTLTGDNFKVIPGQRQLGNELSIDVPHLNMKAGFYELKSGDKVEKLVAFNYPTQESSLEPYNVDEIKTQLGSAKNIHLYEVAEGEKFIQEFKSENVGIQLWKYCLILSLLFLLAEILLIRFL